MRLRVLTPATVFLEAEVAKLVVPTPQGSTCLLPRHCDFVSALVPGVLAYESAAEPPRVHYLALDRGILVKCGSDVRLSVRSAAAGELEELAARVRSEYEARHTLEAATRTALARLEAGFVRSLLAATGDTGERG